MECASHALDLGRRLIQTSQSTASHRRAVATRYEKRNLRSTQRLDVEQVIAFRRVQLTEIGVKLRDQLARFG